MTYYLRNPSLFLGIINEHGREHAYLDYMRQPLPYNAQVCLDDTGRLCFVWDGPVYFRTPDAGTIKVSGYALYRDSYTAAALATILFETIEGNEFVFQDVAIGMDPGIIPGRANRV